MIVKLWDDGKNCWTYMDGMKKVDSWRTVKEAGGKEKRVELINLLCYHRNEKELPISIEVDVSKDELVASIFLLNDEGKTIERIN